MLSTLRQMSSDDKVKEDDERVRKVEHIGEVIQNFILEV
jgi:hypothetical protein